MRSRPIAHVLIPLLAAFVVSGSETRAQGTAAEPALIAAVKRVDLTAVRAVLQRQPNVNETESDGTTALHWAAHLDFPAAAEMLVAAGADAKVRNRFGATPLWLAAEKGHAEVIRHLLRGGADANLVVRDVHVLMIAARSGNADAVKALLEKGANANFAEPTRKQTPLMWAAARGNTAVVKQLIAAGASVAARSRAPNCPPPRDQTFVVNANAMRACIPTSKAPKIDPRIEDPLGIRSNEVVDGTEYATTGEGLEFTPFLFAVRGGHLETVQTLLDAGVDVNEAKTDAGTTALLLAIMNRHWELASVLLDRGADPSRGPGYTALHQIAWSRRLNMPGTPGSAHPIATGRMDSLELAKKMIARGVNVNARMTSGFKDGLRSRMRRIGSTAFLLSSKVVDVPMMRLLVSAGADIHATNIDNSSAIMLAAGVDTMNENEDIGIEGEAVAAVKYLLELGADPHVVNKNGENAMHGAIGYRGWLQVAKLLHEQKVRFDLANIIGWTPVQIADGVFVAGFLKAQPKAAEYARGLYAAAGMAVPSLTKVNPTDALTAGAAATVAPKSSK